MNDKPLVTVIIPTYNRPDFLEKTVYSILDQTYRNLEVIIVSNGASVQNERVARKLGDPRIVYVDQENSGGPSSPRNHGIRIAKGKYIAFCDDDDLWLPHKIEQQVLAMEENPDHGFCYGKMIRFDAKGHEWTVPQEEGESNLHKLLYVSTIPISSVMVRADLAHRLGGFYEGKAVGASEDYEFALRYASQTKLLYVDEYLIKYWCGNNRTTSVEAERHVSDVFDYLRDVLACYYIQMRDHGLPPIRLVGPVLHQLHHFCRGAGYIILKRLGLYGHAS